MEEEDECGPPAVVTQAFIVSLFTRSSLDHCLKKYFHISKIGRARGSRTRQSRFPLRRQLWVSRACPRWGPGRFSPGFSLADACYAPLHSCGTTSTIPPQALPVAAVPSSHFESFPSASSSSSPFFLTQDFLSHPSSSRVHVGSQYSSEKGKHLALLCFPPLNQYLLCSASRPDLPEQPRSHLPGNAQGCGVQLRHLAIVEQYQKSP